MPGDLSGSRRLLRDRAPLAVGFLDLGSAVGAEVTAAAGSAAAATALRSGLSA